MRRSRTPGWRAKPNYTKPTSRRTICALTDVNAQMREALGTESVCQLPAILLSKDGVRPHIRLPRANFHRPKNILLCLLPGKLPDPTLRHVIVRWHARASLRARLRAGNAAS